MSEPKIRPVESRDYSLLEAFLHHAAFAHEGEESPATHLYLRAGYVIVDERPDGAGHEDCLMIRDLC